MVVQQQQQQQEQEQLAPSDRGTRNKSETQVTQLIPSPSWIRSSVQQQMPPMTLGRSR
jgi:transcription initiation factor TFIID subunit TAF12